VVSRESADLLDTQVTNDSLLLPLLLLLLLLLMLLPLCFCFCEMNL